MASTGASRITAHDVSSAAARIHPFVRRTPSLQLEPDVTALPVPVHCKLESLQVTGTFKARNAFALLLEAEVPDAGVVAASGGNFGLAMAHAARRLGHHIAIAVPASTPAVKVAGIRAEGAEVELVPGPAAEAFAVAERRAAATGALLAHPYDLPEVAAGAGTCAIEFGEQAPDLDTVLVAVGGGGLIAGIAAWCGDAVRVVGVETEGTPTLHAALAAGQRVGIEATGVGMSALGAPVIGGVAWAARDLLGGSLLVSDAAVVSAQWHLWEWARVVAEPGGAVALAALTSGAYRPADDERVGVVVCGGNTDPGELRPPGADPGPDRQP